jgi:hypothetical protein
MQTDKQPKKVKWGTVDLDPPLLKEMMKEEAKKAADRPKWSLLRSLLRDRSEPPEKGS